MNLKRAGFLGLCGLILSAAGCNPKAISDTNVMPGVGMRDYFTARAMPDGSVGLRDLPPTPRPRESITTDDYFGIKLEHIYAGGMLGRNVGNLAIIAQIAGIIPDGVRCEELSTDALGFQPSDQQKSTRRASQECQYKTVVQVNPVFRDSHVTFDSAFITPPFRTGNEPLRLQFIIAQLNDVELARKIVDWSKQKADQAQAADVLDLNRWQKELVNIGFTAVNYLIDYAAAPTYVFEMTTDFVPVETVEGAEPQNLLMGGDFVLVGITGNPRVPQGAFKAAEQLIYQSGRLYWKDSREEYRESPYAIFNVVRYSRYPTDIPVNLARIQRQVRRGESADDIVRGARTTVLDLQDARMLNETEGGMLLDLFDWYARASRLDAKLNDRDYGRQAPPPRLSGLAQTNAPAAAGVTPLDDLKESLDLVRRLDDRLFGNYGQTPGFRQDECVTIRSLTQSLADAYREKRPAATQAFENLQIRRGQLQRQAQRTPSQQAELDSIVQIEPSLQGLVEILPDELPEPQCPQMRQAYTAQ
jgi:hypothetical protein